MSYACPMSFKLIDSNVSRLNSLFVSLLVMLYLSSSELAILLYLVYDFSMRLYYKKRYSLIHVTSSYIISFFRIEPKNIDSGAKRLAGAFGLLFVILLVMFHLLDWYLPLVATALIFLSCSLLDAFFNYCIGCKIYFIIKKVYPAFMN